MRRLHPVFPLVAFHLGISGIPDPYFWTFFFHFFLTKFRFFLEGLVRVEHLVLARTRSDFGATLPGGSI